MPKLSVWYIRTSLIYLALGFTFGGLLLWNKGMPIDPRIWSLLPAHIETVLFGWTVLLVMGVAFWIMPRFSSPPVRGNEGLAWWAYVLINVGIFALIAASFNPHWLWLSLLGRTAEAAGSLAFVAHAWPRIKGF